MDIYFLPIVLGLIKFGFLGKAASASPVSDQLLVFNRELHFYQQQEAEVAWNISLGADPQAWVRNEELAVSKHLWSNAWCQRFEELAAIIPMISRREARQMYLMCRGPKFSVLQLKEMISILTEMQEIYQNKKVLSMRMEPDLNNFMETTRNESALRSAWTQWFHGIGNDMRPHYEKLIRLLNVGARNSGRSDMGRVWRDEMEIPNLKSVTLKLYSEVRDLYALLHSVVRFRLAKFYGLNLGSSTIPAHLLGNMWAQKWDGLLDIILPDDEQGPSKTADENPLIKKLVTTSMENATALDLVQTAEKFFTSMGFPRLPRGFYEKSYFTKDPEFPAKNCHGTAANMFGDGMMMRMKGSGDYRIMMCIPENQLTDEDLITLTHEMGHVYYFMAYSGLEPVFQDGANSAFHESVGDSVTYGLRSGQKGDGIKSQLKTALARLPQIGFGLIMDMWRWHVFQNEQRPETWNSVWWELHRDFLGVSPPEGYRTEGLDATGKYHIMENIPYVRYFLASFLQLQFFESLCAGKDKEERSTQNCQLWGNTEAGSVLWKMMSKGSSEHWSSVLEEMTGSSEILSKPLLRYFQPVRVWLENQVLTNNLTLGW